MAAEGSVPRRRHKGRRTIWVGKGQRYQGSRVTPVEGRALASDVFVKEGRTGD